MNLNFQELKGFYDKQNLFVYDRLTGLPSGEYFYELCRRALQVCGVNESQPVFVYYNVENFKAYNSESGYEAGDRFLKKLADTIAAAYPGDLVGRTSNDHFLVLTDQPGIEHKSLDIHNKAHEFEKTAHIEVRTGIYRYEPGVSVTQAHDYAKTACDTIKGDYSRVLYYYDSALRKKLAKEKYIVDNLDAAVNREYLVVYYQPIIRVFSGKICAAESLVRWDDPQLGFMMPGEFVPVLESRRLIHKVDAFVLDRVCRDQLRAKRLGEEVIPVSVNLSRLDFQLVDVYTMVKTTVEKYGVSPKTIRLEITESALNDDEKGLHETIAKLRSDGFEVWLDDFGSEYSTLNTLQSFRFDLLKIDMKFFANFATSEKARTIITTITDMAKRLHMRVLAEGIETAEQYAFLKKIGCDKAQGYHFSRPCAQEVFLGLDFEREDANENTYFTAIGEVNFLSPNPFEDYNDDRKLYNVVPTAIVQLRAAHFHYLYMNEGFLHCLKSMGIDSEETSERVINDDSGKLFTRLESVAHRTREGHTLETFDFIFHGCHIHLCAREIAYNKGTQALFVTMANLSTGEYSRRLDRLETSLNYLYSIYDRVDLLSPDEDCIENIYLGSQNYRTDFAGKSLREGVADYGRTDVVAEDWETFERFYDVSTMEARFARQKKNYLVQPLHTLTRSSGVLMQLYLLIRMSDGKTVRYLSCVRDFNGMPGEGHTDLPISAEMRDADWYQVLSGVLQASVLEWDLENGKSYMGGHAYQYQLCKSSLEDILSNSADREAVFTEDIPIAERFFAQTETGCERAEAVMRLKLVDGSYRWSRIIGLFRYDSEGRRTHVTGVILDVDKEQKSLEQAQFLNRMPTALGVFEVVDGKVRQLFMNDGYYRLIGDSRETRDRANNRGFIENIHPENRGDVLKAMQSVINGADGCTEVCRVRTGGGAYKWIRFTSRVAERSQSYMLIYSTYVSIEEDARVLRAQAQSNKKLEAAVRSSEIVVWEYDCENHCILQTAQSKEKHGHGDKIENVPESLVETGCIHPDSVHAFLSMYRDLHATKTTVQGDFRVRSEGSPDYRWVHIMLSPILDREGRMRRAIGTSLDIPGNKP